MFTPLSKPRTVSLLSFALSALCLSGCVPTTWLPDSSGFVYVKGMMPGDRDKQKGQLVLFDIKTKKQRVIVDDIGNGTIWPAVSPDGKRVAVTRFTGAADKPLTVRVVVYDFRGKQVQQSKEFDWPPLGPKNEDGGLAYLFWSPKDDMVVITDMETTGFCDLGADTMRVIKDSRPLIFGGTPIRPDGKGCLMLMADDAGQGFKAVRTVFMDWKGTEEKIDIGAYSSQKRGTRGFEMELEDNTTILTAGLLLPSWWEGNSAWAGFKGQKTTFQIDTAKKALMVDGQFARPIDREMKAGAKELWEDIVFDFRGDMAVHVEKVDERTPEESVNKIYNRVVVVNRKTGKKQTLVEKAPDICSFIPSPDGKYVALCFAHGMTLCTEPLQIVVISDQGELVSRIVFGE